jgi:hypothetical protein
MELSTGVSLDRVAASIGVGVVLPLKASVTPVNQSVLWRSSHPAVATVSDTGLVTAVFVGTAVITATTLDGNHTATCAITVIDGATGYADTLNVEVKLYPNPFAGKVHLTGAEGCTLQVLTAAGVTVLTQKMANTDESISMSRQPAGLYFFRLEKDGKTKTVKGAKE